MNLIFLSLQVFAILTIQYHRSDSAPAEPRQGGSRNGVHVKINRVCPDGYQLLRYVQPPLASDTLNCTWFENSTCVEQCYWAATGQSGNGTADTTRAGLRNRGDCGSYQSQDSDSTTYNVDVIANDREYHSSRGSTWVEGGYAVYINGLNYSTEGRSDQKRCCLSKLWKVKAGSCGYSGASDPNIGYYRWAHMIPHKNQMTMPEVFINTTSDVQDMASLLVNGTERHVRSNPIVRQFGFNDRGAYDYTIHLCDTEIDPDATCDVTTTTTVP